MLWMLLKLMWMKLPNNEVKLRSFADRESNARLIYQYLTELLQERFPKSKINHFEYVKKDDTKVVSNK